MIKKLILSALITLPISAMAGKYICTNYGDAGCTEHIGDIVTDKFTEKYPASKYNIVVVSKIQTFSNGGAVAYAIAGVSPLVTEAKYGQLELMPLRRFSAVTRINPGNPISREQQNEEEVDVVRRAVTNLMEACNDSLKCDVLRK